MLLAVPLALLVFATSPTLAEDPGPSALKIVESGTAVRVPTRQNPQFLEGRLTMGLSSGPADPLRSRKVYHLTVPPGMRLKAQLKGSPRWFQVQFLSSTLGRTQDPGLFVNQVHKRQDDAYYVNRTAAPTTIYCIVKALEQVVDKPYTVVFTDF